ncbi:SDR family oxidoreductase [Streptomyces sp. NPDC001658]
MWRSPIRINAICPGVTETPMVTNAIAEAPEHMAAIINEIPMKRSGSVEEIASAVLWLSSPGAVFTTGQALESVVGRLDGDSAGRFLLEVPLFAAPPACWWARQTA